MFEELQGDLKCLKRKCEQARQRELHLLEYEEVIQCVSRITPMLEQLLGSKSQFDVVESIYFLQYLFQNGIESAEAGIRKMQVLVWTKDRTVKDEMLQCYWTLFFDEKNLPGGAKTVALNLVNLFKGASLTEKISLEEILGCLANPNNNSASRESGGNNNNNNQDGNSNNNNRGAHN